jgi:hypothetical protein
LNIIFVVAADVVVVDVIVDVYCVDLEKIIVDITIVIVVR